MNVISRLLLRLIVGNIRVVRMVSRCILIMFLMFVRRLVTQFRARVTSPARRSLLATNCDTLFSLKVPGNLNFRQT